MDTVKHNLTNLFLQLGLAAEENDIESFIGSHSVDEGIPLEEAVFWTQGQAQFIKESRENDADWSDMVDELDTLLREDK
ncbi:DUF2789 domain-containing protein [Neptunomonas japonica]|uniref:DUF2789 domain-containing protein n=1 Tax=Neptunomonas japonica JAMM 1380 TaxID=1441457 RepID=A0A7R6PJ73_9GAMM|nr:DUF2789 domain-containing protein [Neptunomonas japonica]BBB30593.1 conserved hypothetical protein [Neptunomonas japonica JAMM 1380]